MAAWLRRYWIALVLIGLLAAILDTTASSLWTCHPPPEGSAAAVKAQYAENCSYLQGPLLVSLEWLVSFMDHHEGFFVGLFTAGLVGFTGALWRSTDGLLRATNESIKIANQEFISTHRPRLIVRRVRLRRLVEGKKPIIEYRVVNIGESRANILEANYTTAIIDFPLPEMPNYDPNFTSRYVPTPDDALHSGQWIGAINAPYMRLTKNVIQKIELEELIVIFIGYVRYSDAYGVVREIGFGRRYKNGRFYRIENEEYEYSD